MQYYPRAIEPKLQKAVHQFLIVVWTGPRQSGKSALLQRRYSDYRYIAFDDSLLRQSAIEDPGLFMENIDPPVILEEIQYVPRILPYIKMRQETYRILGARSIFHLAGILDQSRFD